MPDLFLETRPEIVKPVCGIDEVGRGPLAGPVVAAAVILPKHLPKDDLLWTANDSKKLSEKKRDILYARITKTCDCAIGMASVDEIDKHNILQASLMAMARAFDGLSVRPAHALVDGNKAPRLQNCTIETIVKGDGKSLSIACASIIAKVTRDRIMKDLHKEFPHYGWSKNAGYGTALHLHGIDIHGVTPHHRTSFAPVRNALTHPAAQERVHSY